MLVQSPLHRFANRAQFMQLNAHTGEDGNGNLSINFRNMAGLEINKVLSMPAEVLGALTLQRPLAN